MVFLWFLVSRLVCSGITCTRHSRSVMRSRSRPSLSPELLSPELLSPELLSPELLKPELLKPELLKPERIWGERSLSRATQAGESTDNVNWPSRMDACLQCDRIAVGMARRTCSSRPSRRWISSSSAAVAFDLRRNPRIWRAWWDKLVSVARLVAKNI